MSIVRVITFAFLFLSVTSGCRPSRSRESTQPGEQWQWGRRVAPKELIAPALDALYAGDIATFNTLRSSPPLSNYILDLRNMSFAGLDLRNAHLERCNLAGCNFGGTDLREAKLVDSCLVGARFISHQTLEHDRDPRLAGPADIRQCDFSWSKLSSGALGAKVAPSIFGHATIPSGLNLLEWKKAFGLEKITHHLKNRHSPITVEKGEVIIRFPEISNQSHHETVSAHSIGEPVPNPFLNVTDPQHELMQAVTVNAKALSKLPAIRVQGEFYGANSITLVNTNAKTVLVLGTDFGGHSAVYSRGPVVMDGCHLMGGLFVDAPIWCLNNAFPRGHTQGQPILMGRKANGDQGHTLFSAVIRIPAPNDQAGVSLVTLDYHEKRDLTERRQRSFDADFPPHYWVRLMDSPCASVRYTAVCRMDEQRHPEPDAILSLARLCQDADPEVASAAGATMTRIEKWPKEAEDFLRTIAADSGTRGDWATLTLLRRGLVNPMAFLSNPLPTNGKIAEAVLKAIRQGICTNPDGSDPRMPSAPLRWQAFTTMARACSISELKSALASRDTPVRHAAVIALSLRREEPGAQALLELFKKRNDMGGRAARCVLESPGSMRLPAPDSPDERTPEEAVSLWQRTALPAFDMKHVAWPPEHAASITRSLAGMRLLTLRSHDTLLKQHREWLAQHSAIAGPQLIELLTDSDGAVRSLAVSVLMHIKHPVNAATAVELYLQPKRKTMGANRLLQYGAIDRVKALALLSTAYEDAAGDEAIGKLIAQVLWRDMARGTTREPTFELLRRLLCDPNPEIRREALRAAGTHLPGAMQKEVTAALNDENAGCACQALTILVWHKVEGSNEALERFLASDNASYRYSAVTALGARDREAAVNRLKAFAADDPSKRVRENAQRMINRIQSTD